MSRPFLNQVHQRYMMISIYMTLFLSHRSLLPGPGPAEPVSRGMRARVSHAHVHRDVVAAQAQPVANLIPDISLLQADTVL
jgi:hypothetical protein